MSLYSISFTLFSLLVTPLWLMMIALPRHPFTRRVIGSLWCVVPFLLAYAILEIPYYLSALPLFVNPKLPAMRELLGSEWGATLAWLHFIAVDLFAGRWIYLDSRKLAMNVWLMAPILFMSAMFCPAGITLYLIARRLTHPELALNSASPDQS